MAKGYQCRSTGSQPRAKAPKENRLEAWVKEGSIRKDLIADLVCPYCGGDLRPSREVRADAQQLLYGLLRCRCFEFPVVDGILLLSLAKGYGGAEERLQPYVPLQVAAIHYLQRDDVEGLRAWIARHLPLAAQILDGRAGSYVEFNARLGALLDEATEQHLSAYSRFEHLGYGSVTAPGRSRLSTRARWLMGKLRSRFKDRQPVKKTGESLNYYLLRYLSPRVSALALQLEALPMDGRVLSLCCGHGVFENLLRAQRRETRLVSIDGQFLNLLVTRHFVGDNGGFICHDLQFALPFRAAYFDGVFSSTCLPEIPTQSSFVREAIRVTSDHGWTLFDSIWNVEMMHVQRINPTRHYRFCQNFFESLDDYLPFFDECAGGRKLAVDMADVPAAYLDGDRWRFDRAAAESTLRARSDYMMSVLVLTEDRFRGFETPTRDWLRADTLGVSPAFNVSDAGGAWRLSLREAFRDIPNGIFAPKGFSGLPHQAMLEPSRFGDRDYVARLFCDGVLAPLPSNFDRSMTWLSPKTSQETY